jgi:hypothetical protein
MRRLVLAVALLFVPSVYAVNVTVGCPGGTPGTYPSIGAALAALDNQGPHTINVSGNCSESVIVDQRERLTIQGPATVTGTAGFGIRIDNSGNVVLRSLTVSAAQTAISVANRSAAVIAGVTAQGGFNALDIFGGASVSVGGFNAADAVLLHNSTNGLRMEGSVVFVPGRLVCENNSGAGIILDSGRLETAPSAAGPVILRNNFVGLSVQNGGFAQLGRANRIENNAGNGAILTAGAILHLAAAGTDVTIIEGNPRSGVAVLFNSTFRSNGANIIRNNGSAGDPFRAGISASHNSMVWFGGGQIINQTGRGILADSGTSVRLDNAVISGNSDEAILLQHGAIFESIAGNAVTGTVSCDATVIVFGDLTGFPAFECEKKDKEK